MEQCDNNEKANQRGLEEALSFYIEEEHDFSGGWWSMHKIDIVKNIIKECKTKISMIPGGLMRYLQPLDISINKKFKDELKKRYTKYCIDQKILRQG